MFGSAVGSAVETADSGMGRVIVGSGVGGVRDVGGGAARVIRKGEVLVIVTVSMTGRVGT